MKPARHGDKTMWTAENSAGFTQAELNTINEAIAIINRKFPEFDAEKVNDAIQICWIDGISANELAAEVFDAMSMLKNIDETDYEGISRKHDSFDVKKDGEAWAVVGFDWIPASHRTADERDDDIGGAGRVEAGVVLSGFSLKVALEAKSRIEEVKFS